MSKSRKHIFTAFTWLIIILFIAALGAGSVIYFRAEHFIEKKLKTLVSDNSNELYELTYSGLQLNLKPLSIIVSDLHLHANEQKSDVILKKYPEKVFYSFSAEKIILNDVRIDELIKNKKILSKKLTLVKPVLKLSGKEILRNNSDQTFEDLFLEFRPLFNNYISEIVLEEIEFVDANYDMYNSAIDSARISNADKISVLITNFRTDSSRINSNKQLFNSDDIRIRMQNFHNNMGDSLHLLDIDTLEYSLKSADIYAYGFHLYPIDSDSAKNRYNVFVPYLHMKSHSITRFSIKDSIQVESLEFENPLIKFYPKERIKKININELSDFDLFPLVQHQFSKIEIDSFLLSNARLEIYKSLDTLNYQQKFELLNIELNGFLLDSNTYTNKNKIFYADELEMSVKKYHLKLEDNQHDFKADSMFVSTFNNSLGVREIEILPVVKSGIKPRTSADISCTNLEIKDVNLKTLYHTRMLPTSKIQIIEPVVYLQYHAEVSRKNAETETGLLFELVSAYLKGVYSDSVKIEKGSLNIQNLKNEKVLGYFETAFDFQLSDFSLDSSSISATDKFFYARDFNVQFSDYQMKLVDNLHKITVENLAILSTDGKVEINKLHLCPTVENVDDKIMQSYNRSELYDIFIPKISLQGINLRNAFFHNKLNISSFRINNPKIYFENFGMLRKKQEKKEFTELYQLITNYLNNINIKEINVPNGTFSWINHTKKGKTTSFDNGFSASLSNFRLNENELKKQRLLFSDHFDISVKDQSFQLSDSVHVLRASEINLSSLNKSVGFKNALLYPQINSKKYNELNTTFQITIPELQISNFDFHEAFYSKSLLFNTLEINNPKFQIYNKGGAKKSLDLTKYNIPWPSFINSLKLNELKITNGQVTTYDTEGTKQYAKSSFRTNLRLPNIELIKNMNGNIQVTTKNIIANISELKTPLGKNHELEVNDLRFNRSLNTINISGLKVIPFIGEKKANKFNILAPEINSTGFILNEAINNNHFTFKELDVKSPTIEIEINDSIKGDKLETVQNLDLYPFAEPYVDKIDIEKLAISNVNLSFNWFEKHISSKSFDLNFKEINIAENQKPGNLLNSSEFEFSTADLKTKSKNNLYEFSAENLTYNSAKHNLLLANLKIEPLLQKEEFPRLKGYQTDYLNVNTDFVELQNIDENLWLKDNVIKSSHLLIGKTEASIYRNKRYLLDPNQRPPWPQDLLTEIKQSFIFDSITLMPSYLEYNELMDISEQPGHIDFQNLTFKTGKLSNLGEFKTRDQTFKIYASARFLGISELNANFSFNLFDENYKHKVSGSLSPFPLKELNVMVEKTAPISIESGHLNRFDFSLDLNERFATGEIYFGYDDFKISLFEFDNDQFKKSRFSSFWANKLLINSKNPKGDNFEPQTIYFERDIQRSIIHYWWKAIFSGTKKTLGIEDGKE